MKYEIRLASLFSVASAPVLENATFENLWFPADSGERRA